MELNYYKELEEEEKEMLEAMNFPEEETDMDDLISNIISSNKPETIYTPTEEDQLFVISTTKENQNLIDLQKLKTELPRKVKAVPKIYKLEEVDKILNKKNKK